MPTIGSPKSRTGELVSAFKLIQIDEQFDLFSYADPTKCTRVVDLCAAPGSWSQVLSRVLIKGESFGRRSWVEKLAKLDQQQDAEASIATLDIMDTKSVLQPRDCVKIVAIDLQPMAALEGIIQLKADITHPSTVPLLLKALDPDFDENNEQHRVDLVISDGAPDVTGLHDLDIYIQSQLLHSALALAMKVLRPGGKFVAKIFRGENVDLIYAQLKTVFERVHVQSLAQARASSIEAFVVCEGFQPVKGWTPNIGESMTVPAPTPISNKQSRRKRDDGVVELTFDDEEDDSKCWIAPFLACGDLSAWDSRRNLQAACRPCQSSTSSPPTAPPYKEAIERRRAEGGAYGKTKDRSKPST